MEVWIMCLHLQEIIIRSLELKYIHVDPFLKNNRNDA
jgi:hypothetical protein